MVTKYMVHISTDLTKQQVQTIDKLISEDYFPSRSEVIRFALNLLTFNLNLHESNTPSLNLILQNNKLLKKLIEEGDTIE